jgi:hypothetical protein
MTCVREPKSRMTLASTQRGVENSGLTLDVAVKGFDHLSHGVMGEIASEAAGEGIFIWLLRDN